MSEIRIGASGWSYGHWNGVCYPQGTESLQRLDHYMTRFDTVELNVSYYRWPLDMTFAGWRRRLPRRVRPVRQSAARADARKKLHASEVWIERIARCWHELGDRHAVLFLQLPPSMERDDARLDPFLSLCRVAVSQETSY